jgi:hypothetical protein
MFFSTLVIVRGAVAVVLGKMRATRNKVLVGTSARLAGLLCMLLGFGLTVLYIWLMPS